MKKQLLEKELEEKLKLEEDDCDESERPNEDPPGNPGQWLCMNKKWVWVPIS